MENICHKMSRIYLMFTNLRTLFLTVRSKFLPYFLVHSTPCVSTPVQVSSPNTPCLLQRISFQLSPLILTPFSPLPHSSIVDHCHYIPNSENIVFSRPSHKGYGKEPSTHAGKIWIQKMGTYHPAYIQRLQASAHCLLGALKNTSHSHMCLFSTNK